MIARLWHGVTPLDKADEYASYLKRTGLEDYKAVDGNRGVFLLRRIENDETHFIFLTFWDSEEAVRQFAGDDIEIARYYPEDTEFLIELEPLVRHYEVLADG